jgi:hypothetical protein
MNQLYKNKYRILKNQYFELKDGIMGKDSAAFIIHNTFPVVKSVNLDNVLIINKNIRKMATIEGINFIVDIIVEKLGSNIYFTNITPDIGTDLINFAYKFSNINTINNNNKEINDIMSHNIGMYGLDTTINRKNGNIINILSDRRLVQDVIYIDGFFLHNLNNRIYIDKYEISELVDMFKEKTKMFVFRVHGVYDFNNMFKTIGGTHFTVHKYMDWYLVTFMTDQL